MPLARSLAVASDKEQSLFFQPIAICQRIDDILIGLLEQLGLIKQYRLKENSRPTITGREAIITTQSSMNGVKFLRLS